MVQPVTKHKCQCPGMGSWEFTCSHVNADVHPSFSSGEKQLGDMCALGHPKLRTRQSWGMCVWGHMLLPESTHIRNIWSCLITLQIYGPGGDMMLLLIFHQEQPGWCGLLSRVASSPLPPPGSWLLAPGSQLPPPGSHCRVGDEEAASRTMNSYHGWSIGAGGHE